MSPSTVSVAVVYDTGSRGNPALRGRTGVLAEAIARGAERDPERNDPKHQE